ncbi:hypothetical protein LJC32_02700 [Oscillospiraceae bacterium OttesenSCG-928-F05]|nr:hypothetical protein [Oscillospiraceae bacterium OttesenSCG-928-F05]
MSNPIVNGRVYDWASVDIKIPELAGLEPQEISYSDELEKELAYGLGMSPRGYGRGNYKADGKLSLLRDDYQLLLNYCKSRKIPFFGFTFPMIVVSYANDGMRTVTDVLKLVTITKRDNKAAQGDKSLKVDLDLLIVGGVETDGVKPV